MKRGGGKKRGPGGKGGSSGKKHRGPRRGAPGPSTGDGSTKVPQERPVPEKKSPQEVPHAEPAQVRSLDPPEQEALDALLRAYGVDPDSDWRRGRELRVVGRRDLEPQRRIVLVRPGVMALVAPFEPQTVGLPIAHLARKGARLTLEGAGWIGPLARRRIVIASGKGETLFLYGRTLLARSVQKVVGRPEAGEEVLVLGPGGRCIGIGIAQEAVAVGGKRGEKDAVAVANRSDLGRYLRDAQEALE